MSEDPKEQYRDCPRCNFVNTLENKYCSKCSYPLTPQAYEEVKAEEDGKFKAIERKHGAEIATLKEEIRFMRQMFENSIQH